MLKKITINPLFIIGTSIIFPVLLVFISPFINDYLKDDYKLTFFEATRVDLWDFPGRSSVDWMPLNLESNGKKLDRPTYIDIYIENEGDKPIPSSSFESDLVIDFGSDIKLSFLSVESIYPADIKINYSFDDSKIYIKPLLINSKDIIHLKIITEKSEPKYKFHSRIAGINEIQEKKYTEDNGITISKTVKHKYGYILEPITRINPIQLLIIIVLLISFSSYLLIESKNKFIRVLSYINIVFPSSIFFIFARTICPIGRETLHYKNLYFLLADIISFTFLMILIHLLVYLSIQLYNRKKSV
ncbi:hypothetical protein [Veronia nyctiphanis]|nr:hypothetical protein [Veronia nyctiphanis]